MLFEVGGVIGFLLLAFWIWALIDCISSDSAMVRNLPKLAWLVIVVLLFAVGAILWLLLGRPLNKHWRPSVYGETETSSRRPPVVEDRTRFAPEVSDRRSAELDLRLDGVGAPACARGGHRAAGAARRRPRGARHRSSTAAKPSSVSASSRCAPVSSTPGRSLDDE